MVIDAVSARISSPTFVGRAPELGELGDGLRQACQGDPRTILVGGEAGVGKSRLIEEFLTDARRTGAWTLLGQCIPTRECLPFAPVVEVLRRLSRDIQPGLFDHFVGGARHELARLIPELEPASPPAPPVGLDLDWTRGRLFELILGFLGRLASESCVVLTIEDLQWSDWSTQDLVSYLVRELNDERVLLVGTYRSHELVAGHPAASLLARLSETGRVQRVEVRRFDRSETAEQLAAIVGSSPPASLIDRIHDRSEGNAFFTEELLAATGDDGLALPRTVSDTLEARVALLSEPAQEVMRVVAVAGRRVEHRLLSAAAAMAEPALTVALREMVDRHMLIADDDGYAFRHALLREVVYRSLLPGERRVLHEAYARALMRRLDAAEATEAGAAGELAHHWRAAGDVDASLAASWRAARAAMTSCAYAEAHFQFEQVIDLWDSASNAADEVGVSYVDLLCDAAEAANYRGQHDRAIELMRAALDHLDPTAVSARVSLLHGQMAHYLWESGEHEESFEAAERAARTAPASPPSAARARALTALARSRLLTGRLSEGRELVTEALHVATDVGATRDESTAHQVLGLIMVLLGEPAAGMRHLENAHRLAVDLDHVEEIAASAVTLAVALITGGRLRAAEEQLRAAVDLARERGFERSYGLWLKANQAFVSYELGMWDEAERLAGEVIEPRRVATRVASQLAHLALGKVDVGRGDFASARTHLDAARETPARQWVDHAPAAVAELELWAGRPDRARTMIERGLDAIAAGAEVRSDLPVLCWLGVRAEGDRVERARPLSDGDTVDDATATSGHLVRRSRSIGASGPAGDRVVYPTEASAAALTEAEYARVLGRPDPELWADAAQQLDSLEVPFLHAYARWREAEAWLLGQTDRDRAAAALRTAHAIGSSLRAGPLLAVVERLSRYARIDLTPDTRAPEGRPRSPTPAERLGLTPREVDVLELVAQGKTNAQIGEALFISDKTASVHVSHILAKLGAVNRVEAAGIAHRLELVDPSA